MIKHNLNPNILRAYDIRGCVGETLHEKDAYMIGLGFATTLKQKHNKSTSPTIAVARDGRLTSPHLASALIQGLVDASANVIDVGLAPTPKLYFADTHLKTDGAIQVTGSHNPPQHNGFKIVANHAPFFGEQISELGKLIANGIETTTSSSIPGSINEQDVTELYLKALLKPFTDNPKIASKLEGSNIVWDCGNGAAGPTVLEVTSKLAGNHHVMFSEIDGRFPNHHPDPVDPETLSLLIDAVAQKNAVLGIGFDGDGDRIGLIDAKGRQVPGDLLTAYLARHSIRKKPDSMVIFDVKSSSVALDAVSALGGAPSLWKTGHSHMKMRLKQTEAPIAGEMSGHIFIADEYYGFDDAIYAAIAVLREMLVSGETITEFIDSLPRAFATPELRIPCPDEVKFKTIERIIADVKKYPDDDILDIIDMDGVRITTAKGWWLIRASNTGAELVARTEGKDQNARDELKTRIKMRLKKAGLEWHDATGMIREKNNHA